MPIASKPRAVPAKYFVSKRPASQPKPSRAAMLSTGIAIATKLAVDLSTPILLKQGIIWTITAPVAIICNISAMKICHNLLVRKLSLKLIP